jgi:hypothetical protein
MRVVAMNMDPNPGPWKAIGDITWVAFGHSAWEILSSDGRQVGAVVTTWLSGGTSPPGAPCVCLLAIQHRTIPSVYAETATLAGFMPTTAEPEAAAS